jgi:hypothetical protein
VSPTTTQSVAHTPGPWEYDYSQAPADEWIISGPGFDPIIASVRRDEEKGLTGAEVEANARLIAASPELARMLRAARSHLTLFIDPATDSMAARLFTDIDAVLAKAEGRGSNP